MKLKELQKELIRMEKLLKDAERAALENDNFIDKAEREILNYNLNLINEIKKEISKLKNEKKVSGPSWKSFNSAQKNAINSIYKSIYIKTGGNHQKATAAAWKNANGGKPYVDWPVPKVPLKKAVATEKSSINTNETNDIDYNQLITRILDELSTMDDRSSDTIRKLCCKYENHASLVPRSFEGFFKDVESAISKRFEKEKKENTKDAAISLNWIVDRIYGMLTEDQKNRLHSLNNVSLPDKHQIKDIENIIKTEIKSSGVLFEFDTVQSALVNKNYKLKQIDYKYAKVFKDRTGKVISLTQEQWDKERKILDETYDRVQSYIKEFTSRCDTLHSWAHTFFIGKVVHAAALECRDFPNTVKNTYLPTINKYYGHRNSEPPLCYEGLAWCRNVLQVGHDNLTQYEKEVGKGGERVIIAIQTTSSLAVSVVSAGIIPPGASVLQAAGISGSFAAYKTAIEKAVELAAIAIDGELTCKDWIKAGLDVVAAGASAALSSSFGRYIKLDKRWTKLSKKNQMRIGNCLIAVLNEIGSYAKNYVKDNLDNKKEPIVDGTKIKVHIVNATYNCIEKIISQGDVEPDEVKPKDEVKPTDEVKPKDEGILEKIKERYEKVKKVANTKVNDPKHVKDALKNTPKEGAKSITKATTTGVLKNKIEENDANKKKEDDKKDL